MGTAIASLLLKMVKSKWFWIVLIILLLIGSTGTMYSLWRKAQADADKWESNYDASTTFNSANSKQVVLNTNEFKEKEKGWVEKLKKYKIPLKRVKYVHTVEWRTGSSDTVVVHDTIIKFGGQMVPAEYASKTTPDSCLFMEYIRPKGDSVGVLNHTYKGTIDIIAHKVRPKPKFWNWLTGKWDIVVTVKSPCFADTNVTFNKNVLLEK